MKDIISNKPKGKWSTADYAGLAILVAAAASLFLSGLSLKSLWGSEGRWAVIAREMIQNGNYFLPTINGEVYFDKPLSSYWAIIPFSYFGKVTEASARIPGALAGIGTVIMIFMMGRSMFGRAAGFISGAILATTFMFGFWSRTASAETLNVFAIWAMLWALPVDDTKRPFGRYLLFYLVAAVSSFCKGPLAPSVALACVFAVSAVNCAYDFRKQDSRKAGSIITGHFQWILSLKGFAAALCGLAIFAFFLFLPVIVSGSWNAVELMWKENVVRFIKPFDHVEPFYIYLKYIPVFLLPWTLVAIAALFQMRRWEGNAQKRWMIVVTAAIFVFFTISGSRRSYYILPIVPAFALIMGRSLAGFFTRDEEKDWTMKGALIATGFFPLAVGCAAIGAYFGFRDYSHYTELILGPVGVIASAAALFFIYRGRALIGTCIIGFLLFIMLFWGNTTGTLIGERTRTLKAFAQKANHYVKNTPDSRVSLYGVGNSSLIFYLDRGRPIRVIKDAGDACAYFTAGENYLLTEEAYVDRLEKECRGPQFIRVLTQLPEGRKNKEGLVLLRSG
ncbi:MAG: ArnT family glycosyltransferase [Syntrophorhabdaceae bacterium]